MADDRDEDRAGIGPVYAAPTPPDGPKQSHPDNWMICARNGRKIVDWIDQFDAERIVAEWNADREACTAAREVRVRAETVEDDWAKADWWWDASDPEATDSDGPENIVSEYSPGKIVKVCAARQLESRFGFYLPAAEDADSDDERWFWFDTKEEAEAALTPAEPSHG